MLPHFTLFCLVQVNSVGKDLHRTSGEAFWHAQLYKLENGTKQRTRRRNACRIRSYHLVFKEMAVQCKTYIKFFFLGWNKSVLLQANY